jgi:hypothetical protein
MENYSCNENLLQSADENLPVLAPWPGCGRTVTSANVSKANQRSFKTESVMLKPLNKALGQREVCNISATVAKNAVAKRYLPQPCRDQKAVPTR